MTLAAYAIPLSVFHGNKQYLDANQLAFHGSVDRSGSCGQDKDSRKATMGRCEWSVSRRSSLLLDDEAIVDRKETANPPRIRAGKQYMERLRDKADPASRQRRFDMKNERNKAVEDDPAVKEKLRLRHSSYWGSRCDWIRSDFSRSARERKSGMRISRNGGRVGTTQFENYKG
jgi:hypothetical protein